MAGMSGLGSIRRFETRTELEAKKRRRIRIIAFALLFLMLASSAGYAVSQLNFSGSSADENTDQTNTDQFDNQNAGHPIDYNGKKVFLSSSQDEAIGVSVAGVNLTPSSYAGETLYIDSDSQEATQELAYSAGLFAARVQEACYGACDKNLPEKDCDSNLIVFRASETESKVMQRDKCVFIDGNLASVDAFLYKLFGQY